MNRVSEILAPSFGDAVVAANIASLAQANSCPQQKARLLAGLLFIQWR
jgi:hypothetical protein